MITPRLSCGMWGVLLACSAATAAPPGGDTAKKAEEDFAVFLRQEVGELRERLAEAKASPKSGEAVAAARDIAAAAHRIVAAAADSFDEVRAAVVSSMVSAAIGDSADGPSPAVAPSHAERVRDLYVDFRDRLAKAAATLASTQTPRGRLAAEYADAVLAATEAFVLRRAQELHALDGTGSVSVEWAMLLPLLRRADAAWSPEAIRALPEWMRQMESLKPAEYVCLASGRPKVAYQLWMFRVTGNRKKTLSLETYVANLHRRSNAWFGSKDFLKGIALLKAAALLATKENLPNLAVKTRFRLAEVYRLYGHNQLAAHEMKRVMAEHPQHEAYGRAALMRLKYLYEAGRLGTVIEEAPALLKARAAADYRPQILYIAWVANRREDNQAAADELQKRLLRDYPDNALCADLYFSSAMSRLASGDYEPASRLLDMIVERYPKTSIAKKARAILERLRNVRAKDRAATNAPHGS